MSSELVSAAADFGAFLKEQAPSEWRVVNAEKLTGKTSGIVLSYEQLDVSQVAEGQALPEFWTWVTFQLVLSTPETDAVKGLLRLTQELSPLLQILDASPDIKWGPDATRTRLTSGESAFIIPVAFLASNYPPTPEPEPDAEPDDSEEE